MSFSPHLQPSLSPPKVDVVSANSQLFQVPKSSSLHSLSVSRKRPRRGTETDFRKISNDEHHASAELDYRPNRYRESFQPSSPDASVETITPLAQGTSRKRSRRESCVASPSADEIPDAPDRAGWGQTVIKAVGKVLDLCWSGAFRGFYAGGGQGYDIDMQAGSPTQIKSTWQSSPGTSVQKDYIHRTPIPGQYPEEIERTWVVLPTEQAGSFTNNDNASSPSLRRRTHQVSSPRRRPAVMPRQYKRPTSSRRPSTPTRSPGLRSPRSKDDPGSADVQRYAAKVRRQNKEEDASIRRLNKQLQAMIREGKEALGTTVEVDDLDMECE